MYNLPKTVKWKQTGVFANNYDYTTSVRNQTRLFVTHGPRLFPQLMRQKGQDLGGFSPSALISSSYRYNICMNVLPSTTNPSALIIYTQFGSHCHINCNLVALNYHCTRLDYTCTLSHRMYYEAITRQQAGMKIIYTPI
jgi:hypothetical protein